MRQCGYLTLSLGLLFSAPFALGSAPSNQTFNLNPVVRVIGVDGAGNRSGGTGTIIGKGTQTESGMTIGYFCVLTADHVISSTGTRTGAVLPTVGIGFGNGAFGIDHTGTVIGRLGPTGFVDMAVLKIRYGVVDQAFNNVSPRTIDLFRPEGTQFSVIGFGNTGTLAVAGGANVGYNETGGSYGTSRFINNKVTENVTDRFNFSYVYDAAIFTNSNPADAAAVPGEGVTFRGDSGAPYFYAVSVNSGINNLPVRTDFQFGIHTFGNNGFSAWGDIAGGVRITQSYKDWIDMHCQTVPEPATMAVLGLGALALLRRRRR